MLYAKLFALLRNANTLPSILSGMYFAKYEHMLSENIVFAIDYVTPN
jgi:hypothetical protein